MLQKSNIKNKLEGNKTKGKMIDRSGGYCKSLPDKKQCWPGLGWQTTGREKKIGLRN